ncbi:MAG: phosphatase PAP2 family protein [Phycisphaerae bacterium]|nr:phosphatase PAP2 family protein [Phycisphaerae bacterium]
MRAPVRTAVCFLALTTLSGCETLTDLLTGHELSALNWVIRWNQIAVDTSGLDHTPVQPGETRTFGHQLGPTRSSRAMAMVHIAMFEAVNAIEGGYESYTGTPAVTEPTSMKAAVAQAAHDTLVSLFPSHADRLGDELLQDLSLIPDGAEKANGITLGAQAAAAIITMRSADGSDIDNPYMFNNDPGFWRADPINPGQQPLGDDWPLVTPFVLTRANQFRSPPPPPIDSEEYANAYNEVKELGGDGIVTATSRTQEQTLIGLFWAYDGTPSLCAPPRLYNQIAVQIGRNRGLNVVRMARMLAIVNVAMADAGIAIWESKFYYNYWRPVTGIREADPGTGPTGLGDDNPMTAGDTQWTPLGAPASNLTGPNFTPPFPAYPSGHAGFGGALFEVLRRFYGTDHVPFMIVSDELNGVTVDQEGNTRPYFPRTFMRLSDAEEENGQSRIYLGIHWAFDKTEGIELGNRVGDYVYDGIYQPLH